MRTLDELTHAELEWLFAACNEVQSRRLLGPPGSDVEATGGRVMALVHHALEEARKEAETKRCERCGAPGQATTGEGSLCLACATATKVHVQDNCWCSPETIPAGAALVIVHREEN